MVFIELSRVGEMHGVPAVEAVLTNHISPCNATYWYHISGNGPRRGNNARSSAEGRS
jgi:hypothetical protein